MTGNMVSVTPPNDYSDGLDGFASVDPTAQNASICVGGNYTGAVNVSISGVPSFFGNKVVAKLEYVPWTDKDTPVSATTTISTTTYTLSNGTLTVPVNVTNRYYAYRISLSPANVTGLEEEERERTGMLLSPNPFQSEGLKISVNGHFHYQITDLKGTVLEEGVGEDVRLVGMQLNAGSYLLSVQDGKGKYVQKIVRQ
jgi:hypothetical protein